MRRREFITLLGGTTVAWPLSAHAQHSDTVRRIGVLMPFVEGDPEGETRILALQWTIGRNIRIEVGHCRR